MANNKEHVPSVLGSIARRGSAAGLGEPKRISDFEVAGSFNWLDESNPTILVPGIYSCYSLSCFDPRNSAK